jgi:trehalose 6-phosphate phosphatase
VEHLLSVWPDIVEQINNSSGVLFLTDFDGTLTTIVEKPELAVIGEDTRQLLHSLAQHPRFKVGIISGRALSDLKDKIRLNDIIYAGNHGFEIEGPGLSFISPIAEEIKPFLRMIRQMLTLTVGSIKGVLVEDKGITLSVHYRLVEDERLEDVEKKVKQAVGGPFLRGLFKVTHGKKVYDVKPSANWDKGKAIRLLMKKFAKGGRHSGLLPIYLGDDLTDEDGFQVIEKYGRGVSVHIGEFPNNSSARYFLRSPDEVGIFMSKLLNSFQKELICQELSIQ